MTEQKGKSFPTNKKVHFGGIYYDQYTIWEFDNPRCSRKNVVKLIEKEEAVNNEATNAAVLPNVDRFEHSMSETTAVYSPETLGKGSNTVNSVASTTSWATTDSQMEDIPKFLEAKMAGLRTYNDGTPIINSQADYEALMTARNTIHGYHTDLLNKVIELKEEHPEYFYSQNGYSYGNPNPKKSCCVFSFATALSIKYGKQITPADIKTKAAGWIDDLVHITPLRIM